MNKAQKILLRVARSQAKVIMADRSIRRSERKAMGTRLIAEASTQVDNIDRARNVKSGSIPTCYICNRRINSHPVYICGGLHRHGSCEAGSERWLSSDIGLKSKLKKHFINNQS